MQPLTPPVNLGSHRFIVLRVTSVRLPRWQKTCLIREMVRFITRPARCRQVLKETLKQQVLNSGDTFSTNLNLQNHSVPRPLLASKVEEIEAVLLYSPRTAETFVKLLRKARLVRAAKHLTLICLSPAVEEKAADLSWRERRVAKAPTQDALLEALADTTGKTASELALKKEKYVQNNVSPEKTSPVYASAERPSAPAVAPPHSQRSHTVRTVFITLLFSAVTIGAGAATSDLWMPKLRNIIPLPIFGDSTTDQISNLASRLLNLSPNQEKAFPNLTNCKRTEPSPIPTGPTLTRIRSLEDSLDSVKTMIAAVDASKGSVSAEATLEKLSERLKLLEAGEGSLASETRKRLGVLTQKMAAMETKVPTAGTAENNAKARAFLLAVVQLRSAAHTGRPLSRELETLTNLKLNDTDLTEAITSLSEAAKNGVPSLSQLNKNY